jgi:predicted ATPase
MRILREISETTQVILATHSPLVINELEGDEVTILTRTPEHGTKACLLKDTFNYEERSKIYANGELWLSYANGEDERDLFQAPEAAQ